MIRVKVYAPILAAVICGCTSSPDLEITAVHHTVSPVDTIGTAWGDDRYVFGDIRAVDTAADGAILVMDGIACTIRRYSPQGDYMGEFAGSGSGPGELQDPIDMAVLADGRIAVADWGAWGVFLFDGTMDHSEFLGPMPGGSPMSIVSGDHGSFTGLGLLFQGGETMESGEYFIASWSDSVEETFRFLTGSATVLRGRGGEVEISFPDVVFDSDSRGNLYAALSTDSTFIIRRFDASGESLGQITEDFARTPLNGESSREIMREAEETGEEVSGELYAMLITGMFCDRSDRLWVRMGTVPFPLFRVYDSNGDFLETVSCEDLHDPLFELDFCMGRENLLAWNRNPSDYPKVILLEKPMD